MASPDRAGPWVPVMRYRGRVAAGVVALLASSSLALAIPWLLKLALESLREPGAAGRVGRLAALMIVLALAQGATRIVSRLLFLDAARRAEFDVRQTLFEHLLALSPAFHRRSATGDVMARLTGDVTTLRTMWGPGLLNATSTAFVFAAALVLMTRISAPLTLLALAPYPVIALAARTWSRRLFRLSREVQDQMGALSASAQEDFAGIGVIKAYSLEEARLHRFGELSEAYRTKVLAITRARMRILPLFGVLTSVGTVLVLWIGGRMVIRGDLTLGGLVALQAYLALLTWPTMAIGWLLSLFQRGLAAWVRVRAVLAERPTIADGPGAPLAAGAARGEVEVRDLVVQVEGRRLLDGVSLRIPAGSTCAIVGRTGSGKSTLVEAVLRLVEIPPGAVFLDGRDVTELPLASLRRSFGYAPQDPFLFSATIAENVAFGRAPRDGAPTSGAASADAGEGDGEGDGEGAGKGEGDGEGEGEGEGDGGARGGDGRARGDDAAARSARAAVEDAVRAAGLTPDLAAFPDGLDTLVGERGITLSGGQRQRVALARALAAGPRVLVLDDSLSSVDARTERDVLRGLARATRGRTTILISHRVAAVAGADAIVVLEAGRVVETGTHGELVARRGAYAELYREQLADQALAEVEA